MNKPIDVAFLPLHSCTRPDYLGAKVESHTVGIYAQTILPGLVVVPPSMPVQRSADSFRPFLYKPEGRL